MGNEEYTVEALQNMIDALDHNQKMTKSQEKIIQAATELFAENGFESTSTSDIAKKAGVAEITLFRNFKSKNNLLYHLLAPIFIQVTSKNYIQSIQGIFEKGVHQSSEHVLTHAFKDRLEQLTNNEELLKILLRESYLKNEIKTAILNNITTPAINSTKSFVKEKIEQGEFKEFNEETVANLFFYLLFGYVFMNQILREKAMDDTTEQEELIQIILNGLKKS